MLDTNINVPALNLPEKCICDDCQEQANHRYATANVSYERKNLLMLFRKCKCWRRVLKIKINHNTMGACSNLQKF